MGLRHAIEPSHSISGNDIMTKKVTRKGGKGRAVYCVQNIHFQPQKMPVFLLLGECDLGPK